MITYQIIQHINTYVPYQNMTIIKEMRLRSFKPHIPISDISKCDR